MTIANTVPRVVLRQRTARAGFSPAAARALLVAAMCAGVAAGGLATGGGAEAHAQALAGPDLTRLLRGMAAIKMLMATGAAAAVWWRLQSAVSVGRLALYAAAAAAMAAGPALIWGLAHVALGALLLHAGLVGCLALLWLDPAVAARLAVLVAARRR